MRTKQQRSNLVLLFGLLLVAFASPHLIDDFLYDIPAEFGLSNQQAQILSGLFYICLILGYMLAARGLKVGYYNTAFWGCFLALAGVLKHLRPILRSEPYWSGTFSEVLIIGMIISGIGLTLVSVLAICQADK
jgi:hypothetical protein